MKVVLQDYLKLIDLKNPEDPLYKAVIPSVDELCVRDDELDDPIGDDSAEFKTLKTKMLVHRYPDRALLLTTNKCASRCRYCFRKCRVFDEKELFDENELLKSLEYIKNTPSIHEVVLSGGDALCMPRDTFYKIFDYIISNCSSVKGIRINTRALVYEPSIITDELAEFLNSFNEKLPVVIMTHIIHKREVTPELKNALAKLKCVKVNQTPLLKGINATVSDLVDLSWALIGAGVLPHYLHYLDKAKGISHFRISLDEAKSLVGQLQGHLSGHLIPKLILDMPEGMGKITLNPSFVLEEKTDADGVKVLKVKSTYSSKVSEYKEQKV